jgi:hypothetical protein
MSASFAEKKPVSAAVSPFPEWQPEYMQALFELDPTKVPQRVKVAEIVLLSPLSVIAHNQMASNEREKIEDALSKLRLLKDLRRKEQADAA